MDRSELLFPDAMLDFSEELSRKNILDLGKTETWRVSNARKIARQLNYEATPEFEAVLEVFVDEVVGRTKKTTDFFVPLFQNYLGSAGINPLKKMASSPGPS